jgi:hypothetical protein
MLVLCRIAAQKIKDTIIVDLIHGDYNGIFGTWIGGNG